MRLEGSGRPVVRCMRIPLRHTHATRCLVATEDSRPLLDDDDDDPHSDSHTATAARAALERMTVRSGTRQPPRQHTVAQHTRHPQPAASHRPHSPSASVSVTFLIFCFRCLLHRTSASTQPLPLRTTPSLVKMGVVVTVCTVAALTGQQMEYHAPYDPVSNVTLTYTYIVNGATCAYNVNFNDPGAVLELFNTSASGTRVLESLNCSLTATGCTTQYQQITGTPFQYYTQDFEEFNVTTGQLTDVQNYTYVLMPPVPVQPAPISLTNGSSSVTVTTSQFSTEFGSAITGCVVSAGNTPYTGSDLPATLSSSPSGNSLPFTSYAFYTPPQNTTYQIYLNQLNVNPNTTVDVYFVCYNANGKSWAAVTYQQLTSSSLPTVTKKNGAMQQAGAGWSMAAVAMTAAAALVALMA